MRLVSSIGGTIRRHPARSSAVAVAVVGLISFGLYWFAPWNLFLDKRVDEALPSADPGAAAPVGGAATAEGADDAPGATGDGAGGAQSDPTTEPEAPGRMELARGEFRSLEHGTTGTALIVELDGGSRFLRLQDLETSNGPDLRVILTDQPLSDDWHVWDDGELVDLGPLKGNLGSSNYEIPPGLDLSGFRTAVVWCRRFSVGFGVAPLDPPDA
jgi:hypothetical protein